MVRDSRAETPQLLGGAPLNRIRVKHYGIQPQPKEVDYDWIKYAVIFGGKGHQFCAACGRSGRRYPVLEFPHMVVGKIAERLLHTPGKAATGR